MDAAAMLGQLIPCGGGDPIPLLKTRLLVGRRNNCDIVLAFPNISSQHCELELINGYWQVRDLNSANGVKVNGQRQDAKFLVPGDELSIAKCRYTIEYEPMGDAPPPTQAADENPFGMSLLEKAGLQRKRDQPSRPRLPPKADPAPPSQNFTREENDAMKWLMGDD